MSRAGQLPIAGRLAVGSSRMGSGHAGLPFIILFEQIAPTSRTIASLFGKIPTTSVRGFISPLRRSSGLVDWRRHIGHDAPVDNIEPITTYVRR
jgi:hypothetical protein